MKIAKKALFLLIATPILMVAFLIAAVGCISSLVGQCFLAGWCIGLELSWPIKKAAK